MTTWLFGYDRIHQIFVGYNLPCQLAGLVACGCVRSLLSAAGAVRPAPPRSHAAVLLAKLRVPPGV